MPTMFLIGGPNGAGKTSSAMKLLPEIMRTVEFVNADAIAAGLSAFNPDSVAIQAGKIMLERLNVLAEQRADFAFESTLAARTFCNFVRRNRLTGYTMHLLYVWVKSPELSVKRVAARVQLGGHHVATPVIERRYFRGLQNFFTLYAPLADEWSLYDNSVSEPLLIASGGALSDTMVFEDAIWQMARKASYDSSGT